MAMFEEDAIEGSLLEEAKISKNKDSSHTRFNKMRK
jgi:hypothetical protein